jgi:hypothetical protein
MNDFDQKLMDEARAKRDQMVRDGVACCINCAWRELRPAFAISKPDTFAAHYVQCTWPRLHPLPSSMSKPREAASDPIMQHMAGTECPKFELKRDE